MNRISQPPVSESMQSGWPAAGVIGLIWQGLVRVGKWLAKCPPRHQPG